MVFLAVVENASENSLQEPIFSYSGFQPAASGKTVAVRGEAAGN